MPYIITTQRVLIFPMLIDIHRIYLPHAFALFASKSSHIQEEEEEEEEVRTIRSMHSGRETDFT